MSSPGACSFLEKGVELTTELLSKLMECLLIFHVRTVLYNLYIYKRPILAVKLVFLPYLRKSVIGTNLTKKNKKP